MDAVVKGSYSELETVRIVCGTDVKELFVVDKKLLTKNCGFFASLFSIDMKEGSLLKKDSTAEITLDMPRENFSFLLDFLYTRVLGEISTLEMYNLIQELSNYFQIDALKDCMLETQVKLLIAQQEIMFKGMDFSFEDFVKKNNVSVEEYKKVAKGCLSFVVRERMFDLIKVICDECPQFNKHKILSDILQTLEHDCETYKVLTDHGALAAGGRVPKCEVCKEIYVQHIILMREIKLFIQETKTIVRNKKIKISKADMAEKFKVIRLMMCKSVTNKSNDIPHVIDEFFDYLY